MQHVQTYFADKGNLNKALFVGVLAVLTAAFGYINFTHAVGGGYGYGYTAPTSPSPIMRDYSGRTGDHFYTLSTTESNSAVSGGVYASEGSGFNGYPNAAGGSSPTYRAYNPKTGDHFYTNNFSEYVNTVKGGYTLEGVGFYSYNSINDPATTVFVNPVYRLFLPKSGDHFYTTSLAEHNSAITGGYVDEGTAFYAPQ